MVDFVQLQQIMKEQLEQDRRIRTVDAGGPTLEAAVTEAATLLDLPVRRLEYEVTEKGFAGFLGTGKKEWKIRAYERIFLEGDTLDDLFEGPVQEQSLPLIEDQDGGVYIQLSPQGKIFMKVIPPVGNGKRAGEAQALYALEGRDLTLFDRDLVNKALNEAAGEYFPVGEYQFNPINNTMAMVEITDQEMKASITLSPPGPGGADLSVDDLDLKLKANGVVHGVNEEYLRRLVDRPVYNEPVLVAEGTPSQNGRDAYVQYNFATEENKVRLREGSNGQINFKDLNIIQNVVETQPLAKKIAPEKGILGRTVTGKALPATDGKDISLSLGKNVHLAEDGVTVIADMSGQVLMTGSTINVEPVYTVQGDVNLKTGNIIFLGTVIVTGNVEAGFSIKAAGNIEINGLVEKAELDAEGDIIVHQGVTGRGAGIIRTARSLWAKFIENATIEAGNMVVASDGIINSHVDALKRIVCQGKRAHIVGGRLRASEEINAKILGSPTSGTETICEVGVDPKSKEQLDNLIASRNDMESQLDEVELNLQTLINIKQQRKSLPEDKEQVMQELEDKRNTLMTDLQKTNEDINEMQHTMSSLKTRGRVSASTKVYPGVKVIIQDMQENVRTEYKAVTFVLENGLVRVSQYEEPDEEAMRGPDGYTTN
jgi:uncharacterized protein (DUF342 family)